MIITSPNPPIERLLDGDRFVAIQLLRWASPQWEPAPGPAQAIAMVEELGL